MKHKKAINGTAPAKQGICACSKVGTIPLGAGTWECEDCHAKNLLVWKEKRNLTKFQKRLYHYHRFGLAKYLEWGEKMMIHT